MGNWATRYRKEHPTGQDRRKASEAAEIAELMAEVRELRHENEFLKNSHLACEGTTVTGAPQRSGPRRRSLPSFLDVSVVGDIEVRLLLLARPAQIVDRHQKKGTRSHDQ